MVHEWREPYENTVCPNCGNVVSSEGECLSCGFQLESTSVCDVAHVDYISGAISTASDAARELVRNIKGGYQDFAGTFSPEQAEISNQHQFADKLEELEDDLETIGTHVMELGNAVRVISDQTREPTLGERVKDSIFDNVIGIILGIIIGAFLAWLGLNVLF